MGNGTLIIDDSGSRWVQSPIKKRRKPARALKFGGVRVGDQLMRKPRGDWLRPFVEYFVVTDRWFDPVKGQEDPIKGEMVGLARISASGALSAKEATTVRGLASQQFDYADQDFLSMAKTRSEQLKSGGVIGIGQVKRKRS